MATAAKKRSPKRSARLELREREQKARQVANNRARLFALSPGGSRLLPIEVPSPAVIEARVQKRHCPQCSGRFVIDEDSVEKASDLLLRVVKAHCIDCATSQKLWFHVVLPRPN